MVLVKAMTPPLAPEYTDSRDDPTRPASDPMLTMRPSERSTIPGSTERVTRMGPAKFTSITLDWNPSSVSRDGRRSSQPAQLTQITIAPKASPVQATAAAPEPGSATGPPPTE